MEKMVGTILSSGNSASSFFLPLHEALQCPSSSEGIAKRMENHFSGFTFKSDGTDFSQPNSELLFSAVSTAGSNGCHPPTPTSSLMHSPSPLPASQPVKPVRKKAPAFDGRTFLVLPQEQSELWCADTLEVILSFVESHLHSIMAISAVCVAWRERVLFLPQCPLTMRIAGLTSFDADHNLHVAMRDELMELPLQTVTDQGAQDVAKVLYAAPTLPDGSPSKWFDGYMAVIAVMLQLYRRSDKIMSALAALVRCDLRSASPDGLRTKKAARFLLHIFTVKAPQARIQWLGDLSREALILLMDQQVGHFMQTAPRTPPPQMSDGEASRQLTPQLPARTTPPPQLAVELQLFSDLFCRALPDLKAGQLTKTIQKLRAMCADEPCLHAVAKPAVRASFSAELWQKCLLCGRRACGYRNWIEHCAARRHLDLVQKFRASHCNSSPCQLQLLLRPRLHPDTSK